MRSTLLAALFATVVVTTAGCSLAPEPTPCMTELATLKHMQERNDLANTEALTATLKTTRLQLEMTTAGTSGATDAKKAELAAAQQDEAEVKALVAADAKELSADQDKFDTCQRQHPDN
jgi:hypothetical protein